jgi:hypothetical protein
MTLEYEHGNQARFLANDVGVHTFKVKIEDSRGNFKEFIRTIDVVKAKPPIASVRLTYSNTVHREPLDVTMYASVNPEHYKDNIASYDWYLDGNKMDLTTRKGSFYNLYEGLHELKVIATTLHGHVVEKTENIEVKNNLRPNCKPTWKLEAIYLKVMSNCNDTDGKVVLYDWEVNGVLTSVHASTMNYFFPSGKKTNKLVVKMIAYDDSNESTVITSTIDLN